MKVDKTLAIKEFLRTMEQFREAENLIIPISPEEKKQLEMMAMMQQGGPGAMATAPQGPPQGDTTSMGELTAQTMGAI